MNKITLDITLEEKIWLLNQQEKEDSVEYKEEEKDQIQISEENIEDQKVNLIQDQNPDQDLKEEKMKIENVIRKRLQKIGKKILFLLLIFIIFYFLFEK